MRAFVVDAYDSFVHIIGAYLEQLGVAVTIRRHDLVTPSVVADAMPDLLVLGPGPGHPSAVGYVELVRSVGLTIPTFGVCLGHQAIGLAFGASIVQAKHLVHGKTSRIEHDEAGIFTGVPAEMQATRYHSLVVEEKSLPDELQVSARSAGDGYVMALRHRTLAMESVQFHPESILTDNGLTLIENFISTYVGSGNRRSSSAPLLMSSSMSKDAHADLSNS